MAGEQVYRTNGAVGALLDEYERALRELIHVIHDLSIDQLRQVVDPDTDDEDCRSIQTVLTHVVQSGYTYAVEIRKWLGEEAHYRKNEPLSNAKAYELALQEMFAFTESLFDAYPDMMLTTCDWDRKITVRWGQTYDGEQLMQHAIVHVLRHRRQIERFKVKLGA